MNREMGRQKFQEETREAMLALDKDAVMSLVGRAVSELDAAGLIELIENGFNATLSDIGDKFKRGELFLPELIAAAEATKAALELIEPKLSASNVKRGSLGKVVLATVKGDLHDIGKTIVGCLFTAKGFEVIDLGIDVPTSEILYTAKDAGADIIGTSALLTTTLSAQEDLIDTLKSENLRNRFKVMVGGAAVSEYWAKKIGADGYASNAQEAVEVALGLLNRKNMER